MRAQLSGLLLLFLNLATASASPSSHEPCDGLVKDSIGHFESRIRNASWIHFFDFDQSDMSMVLPAAEFQPGKTYTVLADSRFLYLGSNVPQPEELRAEAALAGKPRSFSMTHLVLNFVVNPLFEEANNPLGGGALGLMNDGSIVVSGYNQKSPNLFDMQRIVEHIRRADPNIRIRATPWRLTDLTGAAHHSCGFSDCLVGNYFELGPGQRIKYDEGSQMFSITNR